MITARWSWNYKEADIIKKTFTVILRFAKPHKWLFLVLFTCVVVTSFSSAFYPYIFGKLVDEVFYGRNMDMFVKIVLLYAAVYFGNALLHFLLNMSWAKLMTDFLFDIREHCFYKALRLRPAILADMSAGDIADRTNSDIDEFMNLIHWNIFYTTAGIISLAATLVIVFTMNKWFFLILLLLIPITATVSRHYGNKTNAIYKRIGNQLGQVSGWVYEIVKGFREIRLLAAEKRVRNRFISQKATIIRENIDAGWMSVKSQAGINGVTSASRILIFCMSAYFIYRNELTIGAFIACLDYFNNGVSYFKSLSNKNMEIQKNMAKIRRVIELMDYESECYDGTELIPSGGGVAFENVSFSYTGSSGILSDVSFEIREGETVSIAGMSGAGKSTIASLILKMYEPERGRVLAFGQDISGCSISSIRRHVGAVLQEVILFSGTIRDNMCMVKPSAADDEIWAALENANLDDFVRRQKYGLDTVIGRDGLDFSGGQRQRLSIARAFLKDPKIIIFDEATSALDTETERAIQNAWQKLSAGRTIIIIAHRYSTIKDSDRVLVIEGGSIAGFDTHERLMESSEVYNRLFREQYDAQEAI